MLSKTAIVIMGLLRTRDLSAYEMLKEIDAMNMRYWLPIGNTTLYESVLRMQKKQLVYGTEVDSKVIYHITEKGMEELRSTIRALFLRIDYDTVWFCLAMMYCKTLEPGELRKLVMQRKELLAEYLIGIDDKIEELQKRRIPYVGLCSIDRMKEILVLEQQSLHKLSESFEMESVTEKKISV